MTLKERFLNLFRSRKTKRSYFSGASQNRLLNNFVLTSKSADSEIRPSLRVLRNRSRDLARNNAYARRYINVYTDNIVGSKGVHLQVRSRDPNGRLDSFANNLIERRWKEWGYNCTADGKLSWIDCQRLFAETYARDGEVLIRLIKNFDNPNKFAIEFIESDFLDHDLNLQLTNGNQVRMGVEINKFGKPVNYHLLKVHPNDDLVVSDYVGAKYNIVPAEEIIHYYHQERPHQTRGIPPLSACLRDLKMLDGYMEAELVAARVGASKMGFFKSNDGDSYTGEDKIDTNNPVMFAEAGTFEQLPTGTEFQSFDPQHPTTAFKDFTKSIIRSIASSLNVSYCTLANDLESVNYSSIRQGALEERNYFQCEQYRMIRNFHDMVYSKWLEMTLLTDLLGGLPPSKLPKFNNPIWRARGWQWIDPKKEVEALKIGVENGFLSHQDVQAGYGRDVEDVFSQIQSDKELAEKFGIQLAFEPFGTKQTQQNQSEEVEESEENE